MRIEALCKKRTRSDTQTHNKHNTTQDTTRTTPQQHNTRHDQNNTTHDHTKNHPPALNNDRRWRSVNKHGRKRHISNSSSSSSRSIVVVVLEVVVVIEVVMIRSKTRLAAARACGSRRSAERERGQIIYLSMYLSIYLYVYVDTLPIIISSLPRRE